MDDFFKTGMHINWLQKVFWVMGFYIFSTGLLTLFISRTSFRNWAKGAVYLVALTGASSIVVMTVIKLYAGI